VISKELKDIKVANLHALLYPIKYTFINKHNTHIR